MAGRFLAFLLLCSLVPLSALAADPSASAGRLERIGSPGTCSATLIRPDIAVTAAHCANPEGLRLGDAPQMFFRPAWPLDAAPLAVVEAVRHPLYAPARDGQLWRFPFDLALVRVARALPERVNPPLVEGAAPEPGDIVTLMTWRAGHDRPVLRDCQVVPAVPNLVTVDCEVHGGESGGAVLRMRDGRTEIVAVLTSRARIGELPVGQASALDLRLEPMLRRLD